MNFPVKSYLQVNKLLNSNQHFLVCFKKTSIRVLSLNNRWLFRAEVSKWKYFSGTCWSVQPPFRPSRTSPDSPSHSSSLNQKRVEPWLRSPYYLLKSHFADVVCPLYCNFSPAFLLPRTFSHHDHLWGILGRRRMNYECQPILGRCSRGCRGRDGGWSC